MESMPTWNIPSDLNERLDADVDGMWEDTQWEPIRLTVMKGTAYEGRDIPLAWQIEFEPDDEFFDVPNEKIRSLGVEPDGYGWANVLASIVERHHPEILDQLHVGDTDSASCVVWVESEATCRLLTEITWCLIHQSEN